MALFRPPRQKESGGSRGFPSDGTPSTTGGGVSGRPRISQMGANPKGWGANLLFGKIFLENCMKMKEIGPRGGGGASLALLGCANGSTSPLFLPPANEVCEGYVFTGVCLSTRGGMRGCLGGMRGCSPGGHAWLLRGHAWLLQGGMRGCSRGACVVALGGACMVAPGGVCVVDPGGHAWFFLGGVHGFCWGCAWFFLGGMHGFFQGVRVVFSGGGVRRIRRDTVNERPVRILLECILVLKDGRAASVPLHGSANVLYSL